MSMQRYKKVDVFLIIGAITASFFLQPVCAEDTGLDKYYNEGQRYVQQGQFDKALENFKKVLYIDRNHSRSSWAVAEIYDKQGNLKKAEKELQYCLKVLDHDTTLSREQQQLLLVSAQEKIKEVELMRKIDKVAYAGKLNMVELNVFLLACTISIFLLFKYFLIIRTYISDKIRMHKEGKIWIDRYWEKREDKEVREMSSYVSTIAIYFVLFFIIMYAGKLVAIYGFKECFNSLRNMVMSLL
ncbi:MAG: tetratricopeptide repeat protein [Candidatus Omnitrophica bacterium]|nr:tetratricopeptide repeat protein [Candidatus Omnitrophota bacterium]